jgi:F-box interacting protein
MDVDGNILRVISMAGISTFDYGFDGPCFFTHAVGVPRKNFLVTMIDLATGNVMRTPEELNIMPLCNLGIGLALPSRTYKAVGLMSGYAQQQPCRVLTIEDGAKWRQVQSLPTPSLVTTGKTKGSPVTIGGVMHFCFKFVGEDYVFRFDLESEEWKTSIKGPTRSSDKAEKKTLTKCMVKLNDALCLAQRSSINIWLIWLLTDSAKGTWVKLYTIPMSIHLLMPLMVMCDGQKLLFCACNKGRRIWTLQVYDPLTRACTHLEKFPTNLVGYAGLFNLHLESFVSSRISLVSAPSI